MIALVITSFICAFIPFVMYFRNIREFREPPETDETFSITVLIPARDEERGIATCVKSVLASRQVDLEVIVLDDGSTDRTAEIVRELMTHDSRLRLETAPPLPDGWAGKQHACFVLSKLATKPLISFLDADVKLESDALCRMAAFQKSSGAALVSGFPWQKTVTLLEKMLIPLMYFILLGFLPLKRMRASTDPRFGAGCGQWFLTLKEAYEHVGGHEKIRNSFHDGIQLPRAYRQQELQTDICDATHLAACRMYHSAGQVWNGLAKNAREGLGSPKGIWFWTMMLGLPVIVLVLVADFYLSDRWNFNNPKGWIRDAIFWFIFVFPVGLRLHMAYRFRQSFLVTIFHPLSITLLLGIQWYAKIRNGLGWPVGWKGRLQSPLVDTSGLSGSHV